MRFLRGSFRLELATAAHWGRWHRLPGLWLFVPVLAVDAVGLSSIRFGAVASAYRSAGAAGLLGIAGGIEVAAGAHALLRGLVSVDADRLWRAAQDARQRWAIAALSNADARERLHAGEVAGKGYGLRVTLPHPSAKSAYGWGSRQLAAGYESVTRSTEDVFKMGQLISC